MTRSEGDEEEGPYPRAIKAMAKRRTSHLS